MTNLQIGIEKCRAVYENLARPLLSQLASVHNLTVREFASIFEISKSHAEEILNHKKLPALDLALRIARYWECSVEELFGWRVDDEGSRRPLLIELPGANQVVRLSSKDRTHDALPLVVAVARLVRERDEKEAGYAESDTSGDRPGNDGSGGSARPEDEGSGVLRHPNSTDKVG